MRRKLDAALDSALEEGRAVGGVLLVDEGGETTYARAFGLADREAGTPVTERTRFRLASVTKPIATALFMSLAETGEFDLSAPVTDHLPDFRPRLPDGSEPVITLGHLMTHTSGLGYRFLEPETGPYAAAGISDGMDQPGLSMAENLARIASAPLYFEPGTAWRYSVGIDVLGAAAEAATGRSLQALLDARVSAPLGLSSLRFHVRPEDPALAVAYRDGTPAAERLQDGERVPIFETGGVTFAPSRAHDGASFPSCGAGLTGDAVEVMAVFRALLSGGGPLLKPETVADMMRNKLPEGVFTLHGPGWGFGYGWGVLADPTLADLPFPTGMMRWGGVYGHTWYMDPGADRIALLLTNTAYEGMIGQLAQQVLTAAYV